LLLGPDALEYVSKELSSMQVEFANWEVTARRISISHQDRAHKAEQDQECKACIDIWDKPGIDGGKHGSRRDAAAKRRHRKRRRENMLVGYFAIGLGAKADWRA